MSTTADQTQATTYAASISLVLNLTTIRQQLNDAFLAGVDYKDPLAQAVGNAAGQLTGYANGQMNPSPPYAQVQKLQRSSAIQAIEPILKYHTRWEDIKAWILQS